MYIAVLCQVIVFLPVRLAKMRALRPVASKRCILNTMNYQQQSNQMSLGPGTKGKDRGMLTWLALVGVR